MESFPSQLNNKYLKKKKQRAVLQKSVKISRNYLPVIICLKDTNRI